MQTVKVHINNIQIGDVVSCPDGHIRTVGRETFGGDSFTGKTLWGDSYNAGNKLVTKIIYPDNKACQ